MTHLEIAQLIGDAQSLVAGRRQLLAAGVPRWFIRNELRRRRWQRGGRQCVVMHNGPLHVGELRWIAVLEVGARAVLDGVTALQEAGATGLDDELIHISTPKSSTPYKVRGVRVHETRRYRSEDVVPVGIPRMRPAVAAVHAALWAASDKQAKLFLVVCVQQRLAPVEEVALAVGAVRRHVRRTVLRQCVAELIAGCRSIGEIDVAAAFRARGLPEPTRQVVRKRANGTTYLDVEFEDYDLVLELDGIQHEQALAKLNDLLRDLAEIRDGRQVVRVSMMAWALDQEAILDALEKVFVSKGWRREAAA
jgi:very-short-patch-repair endonuclease